MLPPERLRKADVLTSVALMALGSWVVWQGAHMPWRTPGRSVADSWFLSPGLFPVVIGAGLILFALAVMLRALRDGGARRLGGFVLQGLRGLATSRVVHRIIVMWVLMGAYIFGLLGRIDYHLGTAAFLIAFMLLFHRPDGRALDWKAVAIVAVVGITLPFALGQTFSRWLNVPLP
jgi:hypothetical protein